MTVIVFALMPMSHVSGQLPDSLAPEIVQPVQDFGFWVGEWAVNLRMRDSAGWSDTVTASAHIYSVLGGRAVMELWNSTAIKGFSIRYHDVARSTWMLWLHWPAPDRAGLSSLEGNFHHGRGEFFSTFVNADSNEVLARYTFSDVTPTTLRWDDAYSTDGGATWSSRWIMDFTRMANEAEISGDGGPTHTYENGGRCTAEQHAAYQHLAGPWIGTVDDTRRGRPVAVTGYQILDDCALLLFAGRTGRPETANRFAHLTWNVNRNQFEYLGLTADSTAPVDHMFGERDENGWTFYPADADDLVARRIRIDSSEENSFRWVEEIRGAGGWAAEWAATVERWVPGRENDPAP